MTVSSATAPECAPRLSKLAFAVMKNQDRLVEAIGTSSQCIANFLRLAGTDALQCRVSRPVRGMEDERMSVMWPVGHAEATAPPTKGGTGMFVR